LHLQGNSASACQNCVCNAILIRRPPPQSPSRGSVMKAVSGHRTPKIRLYFRSLLYSISPIYLRSILPANDAHSEHGEQPSLRRRLQRTCRLPNRQQGAQRLAITRIKMRKIRVIGVISGQSFLLMGRARCCFCPRITRITRMEMRDISVIRVISGQSVPFHAASPHLPCSNNSLDNSISGVAIPQFGALGLALRLKRGVEFGFESLRIIAN